MAFGVFADALPFSPLPLEYSPLSAVGLDEWSFRSDEMTLGDFSHAFRGLLEWLADAGIPIEIRESEHECER